MPKSTVAFVCRECGGESIRWAGQCPHCQAWNPLEEFGVGGARRDRQAGRAPNGTAPARPIPITEVEEDASPRLALHWQELNRVLGGGVVKGSVVLLGGEPGVGKSTLLMHLAAQAADRGGKVLYTSGEESAPQVRMRATRLGALDSRLLMLAENELDPILDAIESERPAIAVVDSIQTVYDPAVDAAAGSVTQVREGAARLMRLAKQSGIPIFLVGHVTKEGAIAGPRVLEHMVDTVLYLEGERGQEFRILRATKNRFGSADEIGIFSMGERGLEEVADPSAALLGDHRNVSGSAVLTTMEGTRPLLVELQSLVTKAPYGAGRRSPTGFDLNRLHMIVAVIEKRAELPLDKHDIFINVAGGIRITETAADLGLALSIISNLRDVPLPDGTVVIGELGLSGEVRRVSQLERRLGEAARRGFTRAIIPRTAGPVRAPGLDCVEVRDLADAMSAALPFQIQSGAV